MEGSYVKGLRIAFLAALLGVFVLGATAGAQTITFWLMPDAPSSVQVPWLDEQVRKFKEETGITVQYEIIGWDVAWSRITTALVTGSGADVFQVGTTWNPQFAATGGLAEIDIDKFGGPDVFMRANLESTTYRGKYYGVPWFAETRVLFYNKDTFAAVGVTPPQTYEEVHEVGKKIIARFGEGSAIAIAGTNAWDLLHNWAIVLWAHGGSLLTPDNRAAAFNEEPGVRAMEWYVDLVRLGLAPRASAEYNQPQADAAFISGNAAMAFMGPWNISGIEVDNPTLNYGVVEPPAGPAGRASFSGGSNLAILRDSRNKEAAEAWIKYLTRPDVLADYTKNLSHMLPATLAAFEDPYYETGVWKTFKDTLSYATAYPTLGVWGDIENAIVGEFKQILADYIEGNLQDIQRYLDAAAGQVNRILARER